MERATHRWRGRPLTLTIGLGPRRGYSRSAIHSVCIEATPSPAPIAASSISAPPTTHLPRLGQPNKARRERSLRRSGRRPWPSSSCRSIGRSEGPTFLLSGFSSREGGCRLGGRVGVWRYVRGGGAEKGKSRQEVGFEISLDPRAVRFLPAAAFSWWSALRGAQGWAARLSGIIPARDARSLGLQLGVVVGPDPSPLTSYATFPLFYELVASVTHPGRGLELKAARI